MGRRRKRERDDSPAEHGNGSDLLPDVGIDEALVFVLSTLAVAAVFFLPTTVALSRLEPARP